MLDDSVFSGGVTMKTQYTPLSIQTSWSEEELEVFVSKTKLTLTEHTMNLLSVLFRFYLEQFILTERVNLYAGQNHSKQILKN